MYAPTPVRIGLAVPFAFIITIGVLWIMQYLIEASEKQLDESGGVHFLDFVLIQLMTPCHLLV